METKTELFFFGIFKEGISSRGIKIKKKENTILENEIDFKRLLSFAKER